MKDRDSKHRCAFGVNQGKAKLTPEQVTKIREAFDARGVCRNGRGRSREWGAVRLAEKFGVGLTAVLSAATRKTWKSVVEKA